MHFKYAQGALMVPGALVGSHWSKGCLSYNLHTIFDELNICCRLKHYFGRSLFQCFSTFLTPKNPFHLKKIPSEPLRGIQIFFEPLVSPKAMLIDTINICRNSHFNRTDTINQHYLKAINLSTFY